MSVTETSSQPSQPGGDIAPQQGKDTHDVFGYIALIYPLFLIYCVKNRVSKDMLDLCGYV